MPDFATILHSALTILVVIGCFNLIIFVHELGHFLAAKWRGLQVDRFQIWFGKPIWKKTYKGVQYGLGWLPFGGFVALPQMAPMESIEGSNKDKTPLPPISPLDKIIVAFAGPLFSLLLALLAAFIVTHTGGKPTDVLPSTVIGAVEKGYPGEAAGLKRGDKILAINGEPVSVYAGHLDGIQERIVLSEGSEIVFTVQRPGVAEPLKLTSKFKIEDTKWYERRALRRVGISPEMDHVGIGSVGKGSPAERAGLKPGDRLVSVAGQKVRDSDEFLEAVKAKGTEPFDIAIVRTNEDKSTLNKTVTVQAEVPVSPEGKPPMIGIGPADFPVQTFEMVPVTTWGQITDSLEMMWVTICAVASPKSNIGIDHLSSVVGIATVNYQLLNMEHPFSRVIAFFVLFNVNLAVLNMLPLPVLDGGHIVLATLEAIFKRPVRARFLEIIQTGFALLLFSVMIYVTSKDVGDHIGPGRGPKEEIVFKQR